MPLLHKALVLLLLLVANCAGDAFHIYAASSLAHVLEVLRPGLEGAAGIPVRLTTASSGTLARQIRLGAPADIFISASVEWMEDIADLTLRTDDASQQRHWAKNRLVCVVSSEAAWTPKTPADLNGAHVQSIALGADTAPVGAYAREALANAGVPLPARIVEGLNARDTLAKVALGGAEVGVVYETDVALEPRVRVAFRFDPALHAPIVYPIGILARTEHADACKRVVGYLQSAEAGAVLRSNGFTPL